jgi:hypothetical protein
MTLMDNNYWNPPVDANAILSDAQNLTATAKSTNKIDLKAVNLHNKNSVLVINPITLASGETLDITIETGSTTSLGTVIRTLAQITATFTEAMMIPLNNLEMTERYLGLGYAVSSGADIDVTAYIAPQA